MTYKWSLADKKEQLYHELKSIETKLTNIKCHCESSTNCVFCESRSKFLQYVKQFLDQIDVSPLYKIQTERFFHQVSSHGYPEFTFSNLISLRKRLSYFKDQMTEFSICHPSVISNDIVEKFDLATHKFLESDYVTWPILIDGPFRSK